MGDFFHFEFQICASVFRIFLFQGQRCRRVAGTSNFPLPDWADTWKLTNTVQLLDTFSFQKKKKILSILSYKACLCNLATSTYQNISDSQNNLILEKYMGTSRVLNFFFQLFILKMFKPTEKLQEQSNEYLFL